MDKVDATASALAAKHNGEEIDPDVKKVLETKDEDDSVVARTSAKICERINSGSGEMSAAPKKSVPKNKLSVESGVGVLATLKKNGLL